MEATLLLLDYLSLVSLETILGIIAYITKLLFGCFVYIRSQLGEDLVFCILDMNLAIIKKRVNARHHGQEEAFDALEPIIKVCDPIGAKEKNAFEVRVDEDMSKEDVVNKIIEKMKMPTSQ